MKIKLNYIIIPILTVLTMSLGGFFTRLGMEWYHTELNLPAFTPPDWIFSPVWTLIFILTAVFATVVWNSFPRNTAFWAIILLLGVNMVLNVLWCYLFFTKHMIAAAFIDSLALTGTVYIMIVLAGFHSWRVAWFLFPYAIWGMFACYLNYMIMVLNK